jgi:hypothetical protein
MLETPNEAVEGTQFLSPEGIGFVSDNSTRLIKTDLHSICLAVPYFREGVVLRYVQQTPGPGGELSGYEMGPKNSLPMGPLP